MVRGVDTPDEVGWGIVSLGRLDTVRGIVTLGWEYKDGRFEYTVTLPDGINATYNGARLCEGKNKFIIKGEEK